MFNVVRLEDFGKDHGLIHEAVVTGRKVGAGNGFWSGLAHDEDFFREVVHLGEERGYADLINGMFVPPQVQLEIAMQRNTERGWGFTDEDFASLGELPVWPEGKLSTVVLVVELDTVQRTFEEAWYFAALVQPDSWRWDKVLSGEEHLRLYPGIEHKHGLRWRVVDVGANTRKSSNTVSQEVDASLLPHSALLWLASCCPKWVQSMDGKDVPYVDIPGYQLTIPGYEHWARVPFLRWSRACRQVGLLAYDAGHADPRWAVPVFRE